MPAHGQGRGCARRGVQSNRPGVVNGQRDTGPQARERDDQVQDHGERRESAHDVATIHARNGHGNDQGRSSCPERCGVYGLSRLAGRRLEAPAMRGNGHAGKESDMTIAKIPNPRDMPPARAEGFYPFDVVTAPVETLTRAVPPLRHGRFPSVRRLPASPTARRTWRCLQLNALRCRRPRSYLWR